MLLVPTGSLVPESLEAAQALTAEGVGVTVVDPRWILPVPGELLEEARRGYDLVVTVEDGIVEGGFGWAVRDALSMDRLPVLTLGVPRRFLAQATRASLQRRLGLDAVGITTTVGERLADLRLVAPLVSRAGQGR